MDNHNSTQIIFAILFGISFALMLAVLFQTLYLWVLALASTHTRVIKPGVTPKNLFAIVIPAHDEEAVIADTVKRLRELDYPAHMFDVHIVADHCTDDTAPRGREAGGIVHERNSGSRTGKGAALTWLFGRILSVPESESDQAASSATNVAAHVKCPYTAVIIFDADTRVAPDFLRIMDARLAQGDLVIQGQHRISNREQGLFPALTHAMFLIDNRFQNQGRTNLGLSAKIMGDSVCFNADVLRNLGWGEGLTEDYQLRLRLLKAGVRVVYEPAAIGNGEAALTWKQARAQRARWLTGTHNASQELARPLLGESLRRRDWAMLDGALQARSLAYSTLTLMCMAGLALQIAINTVAVMMPTHALAFPVGLVLAWAILTAVLFVYPFFGLGLEKAPASAYAATICAGPMYIFWRTRLAFTSRLSRLPIQWVRTEHGKTKDAVVKPVTLPSSSVRFKQQEAASD